MSTVCDGDETDCALKKVFELPISTDPIVFIVFDGCSARSVTALWQKRETSSTSVKGDAHAHADAPVNAETTTTAAATSDCCSSSLGICKHNPTSRTA
jgi:hypothetical protein